MHNIIERLISGGLPLECAEHKALLDTRRGLYASLLLLPGLSDRDAMGIITRLLATTRGRTERDLAHEDAILREVLPRLAPETVLEAFVKLARARVNNRRTSGWMRAYILGSPHLEKWAVSGRTRLRRLLIHAMGRDTVRVIARFLVREKHLDARRRTYLRRNLYRYGTDKRTMRRVFLFLIGDMIAGDGEDVRAFIRAEYTASARLRSYEDAKKDLKHGGELPLRVLKGLSSSYHRRSDSRMLRRIARREKERRDTDREAENDLLRMTRALYESGAREPGRLLKDELEARLAELPVWNERIVVVADNSASMKGFGHRLHNGMAVAALLTQALRLRGDARIIRVPDGEGLFPRAEGVADIASALVEAYRSDPDVIIVISDGYENAWEGDAALAHAALSKMSLARVLHVVPAFTERERLEDRALSGNIPMTAETLNAGLKTAWLRMRLAIHPEAAEELLTDEGDALMANRAEGKLPREGVEAKGRAVETA